MTADANTTATRLILVIGATGAQGLAVIDGLLEPTSDGSPSPYSIRALTRDPESVRARGLAQRGVQVFKACLRHCKGYGAFVNTDTFTIGEMKEVYTGMRIFELAKQVRTVKHYVWSALDYAFKKGGYTPTYRAEHYDGKGRVSDWMRAQRSIVSDHDMSWSVLTTGPYMDMLNNPTFGPLNKRADGTYVFAAPIGNGHVPMIALSDVGFFARYIFDHREATSAQELEVASDWVDWPYLVSTFTKITGKPAVYRPLSMNEWFALWNQDDIQRPLANEKRVPDGSTTWEQNFRCWWALFRDDVIQRDFGWIRKLNPHGHTLESWMRETGYDGDGLESPLKNAQDGKSPRINHDRLQAL